MSELIPSQPWKSNNSGRRYTGHTAVGADAEVNGIGQINSLLQDIFGGGTYSTVAGVQETMTGSPPIYSNGLSIKVASNYSSAPTSFIGIEALGATLAGNTAGATILAGFFGGSIHRGTGTVAQAYGVPGIAQLGSAGTITHAAGLYATVTNNSSGTITNAYGLNVATSTNSGGGTITTNYGLLLGAQAAGATNYNLYSSGGTSDNYFEGYVRTSSTGGFYMNALGSINNRFVINQPNTADATAECIIYPSSTARKPLVLQARSSQTADILEAQDSSGNMLAQIGATGKISVGNSGLGSDGLDVFTAGSSAVAIFQGNGMINGSVLVGYTVGNSVTGAVYGYKVSGSTTQNLYATVQQNGDGNAVHEGLVLGTGDAYALYNINGGAAWSVGLDNSDSDAFVISNHGTLGTSNALRFDTSENATLYGDVTMTDAKNFIFNATTGTKIGTATTQKIGFFNKAPIVQPTALSTQLTSITHTAPGTPDYAIQDLTNAGGFGFATKDEGNTVLSVIANLQTRVAELEAKLSASGGGLGLIA